jgi:predicted kinase
LPGSGKSTYVKKRGAALSSDELRRLLIDDPENQTIHTRVFRVLRTLLKERLDLRRPVTYIDATNLTPRERRPYFALARKHHCSIDAVFFNVPVATCQRRNRKRDRVVPDEVITEMARRLVPPTIEEGFDHVIEVP